MKTDNGKLWALLFALSLTLAVHASNIRVPFIYDDVPVILNTPELARAENLPKLFSKAYYDVFHERTWRPAVTASYFADRAVWGLNPKGYHLTALVLHALATALVFAVGWELFGSVAAAAAAALVFGLHPAQVETLAMISNRKEILGGAFFLIALLAFVRNPKPGTWRTGIVMASFLMGLWSMEMTAVLPAILLLYLWLMYGEGERKWLVRRNAPVLGAMGLMVAAHLALLFGPMRNALGGADLPGGSLAAAAGIMPRVFVEYARLIAWPHPLCADYYFSPLPLMSFPVIASILFCGLYVVTALVLSKHRPRSAFLMLFVPIALLPVSNIIPFGAMMAERYLYIPMIAAALGFGRAATVVVNRNRAAGIVLCAAIIGAFGLLSMQRYKVWDSEKALWTDTARCAPDSATAHMNLGNAYLRENRADDAIREFGKAAACPAAMERYKLAYNLGLAYLSTGNKRLAAESFRKATDIYPAFAPAWQSLAQMWAVEERDDMARRVYKDAIRENPYNAKIFYSAGIYLLKRGKTTEDMKISAGYLRRAAKLDPDDAMTHAALGAALLRIGNESSARKELNEALRLDPGNLPARSLAPTIDRQKTKP